MSANPPSDTLPFGDAHEALVHARRSSVGDQHPLTVSAIGALSNVSVDLGVGRCQHQAVAFDFDVDPFRKKCLLNGLDDIGITMKKLDKIRTFETARSERYPWLDGATTRVALDRLRRGILDEVGRARRPSGGVFHPCLNAALAEFRVVPG